MIFYLFFLSLCFASPQEIRSQIDSQESSVSGLKPGNAAKVALLRGKEKSKTSLAFLYVHGFSASPKEASPLTEDLATQLKSHAYLMRLDGHGLEIPLQNIRLEKWQDQVREAIQLSSDLGEELVIVSTSTGAAVVASVLENSKASIRAVIFLSPFFGSPRWDSNLLLLPFGGWLANLVFGATRTWKPQVEKQKEFWSTTYPSEATVQPVRAARAARSVDYSRWKFPTLIAVHPKDPIIDHGIAQQIFSTIQAPKEWLSVPEAENNHVIAGEITSPKGTRLVKGAILNFLKNTPKQLNFP